MDILQDNWPGLLKMCQCLNRVKKDGGERLRSGADELQFTGHSGLSSVLINKVLLRHILAYLFTYCLWLLSHLNSKVQESKQRPIWPFTEKFVNLCLRLKMT